MQSRLRGLEHALALLAIMALTGRSANANEQSASGGLEVREANGISYVSGGVGAEEGEVLKQMGNRFNLKVTFATEHGKYLGGGPVRIEDANGKTLLDATSEGPTFLVKLPPGSYKVSATANGKPLSRTVQLSSDHPAQVAFVWPDAPGDSSRAGDAPQPYGERGGSSTQEPPAATTDGY